MCDPASCVPPTSGRSRFSLPTKETFCDRHVQTQLFRPVRAAQRQAFVDAGIEVPDALRPRGRPAEPEGRAGT